MAKQTEMDALQREIISKDICPELSRQATQLVMGEGSFDADIVFIGEAPGKKEDELGRPFVGAAGKVLNSMLEAAEMVRDDVYITNIVKYRPPNNRDPLPAEKAAFLPYLLRQLDIIQPTVVVTLGRHSMEYFLPGAKIGEVHGRAQVVTVGQRALTVVPLYHPAATLYNGSLRQTLFDDFLQMQQTVTKISRKLSG